MNLRFSIQDKNLIEGLRSQDRKAQQWLFQKLNRKMFALCNRYIADPYQAEDVMMGGFMIVFSKTNQFIGGGNLEGWIRRIMVTQSLQFLRKSKTMEVVRYNGDEEVVEESSTAFTANLDYEVLLRLVQQLPMGYRMVFNLFAIEGYNHLEISEMLSISEGASKSQLFKARTLLQTWVLDLQKTKINQKN